MFASVERGYDFGHNLARFSFNTDQRMGSPGVLEIEMAVDVDTATFTEFVLRVQLPDAFEAFAGGISIGGESLGFLLITDHDVPACGKEPEAGIGKPLLAGEYGAVLWVDEEGFIPVCGE